MRKMLVAVDGSECAMRALNYAIRLAKECPPVQLHLVTVHPEPVIYGEIQVYITKEKMIELQRKHSEDLLRPAIEAATSAGIAYTAEVVMGDTAPAIAGRAEALGCDSIVMGTHGMGAIGALIVGSVATKVVHLATAPVTLVK